MANRVYRGSQSLLEVQGSDDTPEIREQELTALLSVIDEVPPIPVNPPQGLQAELGLVYLYNPDASNTLIKELNSKIGEVNQAVEDITSLVVNAVKVLPYSELNEPIAKDTPCYYEDCIYVAANNIDNKPEIFDPSQWVSVGTVDYNQLKNKPDFITKDDLSCTATGLTYNSSTGVLSLTSGYVIPTETAISDIETGLGTVATNLATEVAQRTADINSANDRIDGVSRNLNTETNARTQADTALNNQIGAVSGSLISHTSNTNNPHEVTKAQVGLGNVNNTSDLNKPISTATQQALDTLNGRITTVSSNLTTNYRTAASQDTIDAQIRNSITAVSGNVAAEATARSQADAALGQRITAVENVIPSAATQVNQLADKNYVNESVERMASSYITASASGNAFGNYARLISGPWYYQGVEKTPDANDYAIVTADEEHDDSTTRYTFDGAQWDFQYVINSAPMTQEQIDALNSTITKAKVDSYDAHIINENNPHNVTKAQLGLENVDNTSDLNKPISNDTLAALNLKANTADLGTAAYTDTTAYATAVQGEKADTAVQPGDLADVATSGDYSDLINKPTIPAAQIQSDWSQTDSAAVDYIKNKPTIPTVNNATLTIKKNGTTVETFTANASSDVTANITVPTKISDLTDDSDFVHTTGNETIGGSKTFTSDIITQFSTKPDGNNHYNTPIVMKDSDGVTRGFLRNIYLANGNNMVGIQAQQEVGGVTKYANIEVGFDNNGDAYTSSIAPGASSSTGSTQIATVGWVNDATKSTNVVHRSGDETIGGDKKFTGATSANGGINLYNTNVTKGTTPASKQYWALRVNDSSNSSTWQNARLGVLEWSLGSNNRTEVSLGAYANTAGSSTSATIIVGYDTTNSIAYTSAPTPTDTTTTSGRAIATTGWVNTVGNNVMHLTSNETIAGIKTFTDTINTMFSTQYPNGILHKNTLIPNNYSSPASDVSVVTNGLTANDGTLVAYEQMSKSSAGVTTHSILVRNRANSSGSNRSGALSVSIDSSGNVYTYAPTPPGSANGTTIATTAWIRSHMSPDTSSVTNINSQGGAASGTYTVTGRGGWLVAYGYNGTGTIKVNDVIVAEGDFYVSAWSGNTNCQIIVKTGDVVKWNYTAGQSPNIKFMPFA